MSSAGHSRNSAEETEKWSEIWENEKDVPRPRKYFSEEKGLTAKDCRQVQQHEVRDLTIASDSMEITGVLSKSDYAEDESMIWVGSRDEERGTEDSKYKYTQPPLGFPVKESR